MLYYFKKSETFTPPIESYRSQGNVTWDMDAHGHDGPISATFPPQFVPSTVHKIAAHKALGIPFKEDQASGDNIGSIWYPQSARADDFTRSYSKREFYDPVKQRPNLHFLAENTVTRILFDGTTAVGVEVGGPTPFRLGIFLTQGHCVVRRGPGCSREVSCCETRSHRFGWPTQVATATANLRRRP